MFRCCVQTITRIATAKVAPIFGTVFLVTYGSRVPEADSHSQEMYKAQHPWKAAFLFNYFLLLVISSFS